MKRSKATDILIRHKLDQLSNEERSNQLTVMLLECWNEAKTWKFLPEEIKVEFEGDELLFDSSSSRYDVVLRVWLEDELQAVSNEYLIKELGRSGIAASEIQGEPSDFFACPCCGRRTLEEIGAYDICKVCWWEDDGQDNQNAHIAMGGPNYGISLSQARYNYLTGGLYDPSRKDLMKKREPAEMYVIGRVFKIKESDIVYEVNSDWACNIYRQA